MEPYSLPLFLFNTLLILGDATLGYHLAPRLLQGMGDPEMAEQGVRPTRAVLTLVVGGYMFFNCRGYFLAKPATLATVLVLVLADMALQLWLARRKPTLSDHDEED